MPFVQKREDGSLLLSLYVQPRSSRNAFAGLHDNALKLRLTTPPIDGKANKAVIAFLAKTLNIPRSAVVIQSGLKNRRKQVLISGVKESVIRDLLDLS